MCYIGTDGITDNQNKFVYITANRYVIPRIDVLMFVYHAFNIYNFTT